MIERFVNCFTAIRRLKLLTYIYIYFLLYLHAFIYTHVHTNTLPMILGNSKCDSVHKEHMGHYKSLQ